MTECEFIVNPSYDSGAVIALINSDIDAQLISNTRLVTTYSLNKINITFQDPLDDTNFAIVMQIIQNRDTFQYSDPIQLFQYRGDTNVKASIGGNVTNIITESNQQNLFSKALIGKNTSEYNVGTASQSGTTITGVGTTFTKAMIGGIIIFADGSSAGINAYGSTTSLTSGVNQTIAEQTYTIYYGATNIMPSGKLSAINPLLASPSITDPNDGTKSINILSTGITTGTTLTLTSVQTTSQTLTIPNISAADTIVTEQLAQSLTNKTLTDVSNNITARSLVTATGIVSVNAANAPTAGQVLTATSGTAATWQTPAAGTSLTLNGLTNSTQTIATGTSGTDFTIVSSGSSHTFNIPDASETARGLITTGAQTLAGVKTFSNAPVISSITNTGTITLPTSTDTLVGRATSDTLTNKTLTGATNTIAASQLRTTGADVVLSAATAPSVGQVLTASGSGATAIWATPSGGTISWTETVATADAALVLTTTYATLTGMTVTPASGTYLVKFSSSAKTSSSTVTNFYAIFSAGTLVAHSERNHGSSGGTQVSNSDFTMYTQAVVTVNGSEAIDVRVKVASTSPTFTFHERSLIILKLA